MQILAADIGGTNSRFGHFIAGESGELELKSTIWLSTKDAGSFDGLLRQLAASDFGLKPKDADVSAFAVAGPVVGGTYSKPPLIGWEVDISRDHPHLPKGNTFLINDFVAQAYACITKPGLDARQMLIGTAAHNETKAVIGAGTGLGKAALVHDGNRYFAMPSEGGHTNFPFMPGRETEYHEFLIKELGEAYVVSNTVVAGGGLSLIHRFLTGDDIKPEDLGVVLSTDTETLRWCARFYARVCRNFAIETLSTGGLYIAGGVAARVPGLISHPEFEREFRSSERMAHILAELPVYLITDQDSGLWGAAECGLLGAGQSH